MWVFWGTILLLMTGASEEIWEELGVPGGTALWLEELVWGLERWPSGLLLQGTGVQF